MNGSAWKKIVRGCPHAIAVAILVLWLTQLAHWALWESRRKPVTKTLYPQRPVILETTNHVEAAVLIDDPQDLPACPFTIQFPFVDNLGFNSEYNLLEELTEDPYSTMIKPPAMIKNATPDPPPKNPAEALTVLRYRGFLQTTEGNRIAFVEDEKKQNTLRIQVGDSIEGWELTTISRDRIIFVAEDEPPFNLLRHIEKPEAAPSAEPPPAPITPEQDSKPENNTDSTPEEEPDS